MHSKKQKVDFSCLIELFQQKEWDERMTKIMTFSTVEDFWAVYHHVALPSRLHIGADYMVFKSGIAPKWEDVQNAKGGSWVLETGKKQKEHLDAGWLESLLACIGERECAFDCLSE